MTLKQFEHFGKFHGVFYKNCWKICIFVYK
nr:MAG TPA: hypothetical protein [Bacteriophage sp.]DAW87492.1 MAG TPA: hypothetical protein [Bacteriophage sp.]